MVSKTEELLTVQVSTLRNGFDKLFMSLQTNFAKLIAVFQNIGTNMIKAFIAPEAFKKAISGQPQGKGKAKGTAGEIFTFIDDLVGGLKTIKGDEKDPSSGSVENVKKSSPIADMFNAARKPLGAMKTQFASLGPQAMLAAVALQPIQELLTGLLEPLEPITDIFGTFGTLLSQMFLPVMNLITPFLVTLMPIFDALGVALAPLVTLFFQFSGIGLLIAIIQPFIPLITLLATLFSQLMTAISPLLGLIGGLFGILIDLGITALITGIVGAIGNLGINMNSIMTWFTNLSNAISAFVDKIVGWFNTIKGQSISDWSLFKSKEKGGWW